MPGHRHTHTPTHTHTHTHTHSYAQTAAPVCVVAAGRWVQGGHCMEDSSVVAAKLQPEKTLFNTVQTLSVCVSAGPVWHSMWMTIWHYGLSSRRLLISDPVSSRSPLRSNLSRGWRWAGAASAAANSGNMFQPSVVYFPSVSLFICSQLT